MTRAGFIAGGTIFYLLLLLAIVLFALYKKYEYDGYKLINTPAITQKSN